MIVGAVAVVTAVAAWQIVVAITSPDSCGTGMVVQGTECVGVTDGSHVFDPSLATVEGKITAENRTVQSAGDFVSVALLTPLTTDPGSDVTLARIRAELESAYTAQQYLNGQGFRPRIRLLLANEGSQEQAWPQVVRELQSEVASQHLVSVVGVGLSTIPTLQTARALAACPDPLPMIGTVDTADGLNSKGPPGLSGGTRAQRADPRSRSGRALYRQRGRAAARLPESPQPAAAATDDARI